MIGKYILDTNTFFVSYKQFYQFDIFPSYWKKLSEITKDSVFLTRSIMDEIAIGKSEDEFDDLDRWMQRYYLGSKINETQDAEILVKYAEILNYINESTYYNDKALRNWSNPKVADPWIIASACCKNLTIVSNEQPNGNLRAGSPNGNPKIPDIAGEFGVQTISLFEFQRTFNFRF